MQGMGAMGFMLHEGTLGKLQRGSGGLQHPKSIVRPDAKLGRGASITPDLVVYRKMQFFKRLGMARFVVVHVIRYKLADSRCTYHLYNSQEACVFQVQENYPNVSFASPLLTHPTLLLLSYQS
jgi:hypothetical protein